MEDNLLKTIGELKEKAARYDNVKKREEIVTKKVTEALQLLTEAVKELNPTFVAAQRGPRTKYNDMLDEQYKKLEMGMEITSDTLRKDYPELDDQHLMALYMKIVKAPKVESRKDENNKKVLYIRKNY